MFEEASRIVHQIQSEFNENVQDLFGRSIDENVFIPTESELVKLEGFYKEAEAKMAQISAIMLELRTIL